MLECYRIWVVLTLLLEYEIEWDRGEVSHCSHFSYGWVYWSNICTSCKMHDDECTLIRIVKKLNHFQIEMLPQLQWQNLIRPHILMVQIDSKVNCAHTQSLSQLYILLPYVLNSLIFATLKIVYLHNFKRTIQFIDDNPSLCQPAKQDKAHVDDHSAKKYTNQAPEVDCPQQFAHVVCLYQKPKWFCIFI